MTVSEPSPGGPAEALGVGGLTSGDVRRGTRTTPVAFSLRCVRVCSPSASLSPSVPEQGKTRIGHLASTGVSRPRQHWVLTRFYEAGFCQVAVNDSVFGPLVSRSSYACIGLLTRSSTLGGPGLSIMRPSGIVAPLAWLLISRRAKAGYQR